MQPAEPVSIDRRRFLIKSGWMAAGVTVLASCNPIYSAMPALPSTNDPEWSEAITWIQILPDGNIRFFCPRMEMGQGAPLGLSQVVAEELNIGPNEVQCVLPHTSAIPQFPMTVGSRSIADFYKPVSQAGAHLREVLRTLAAEKMNLRLAEMEDNHGGFKLPNGQHLSYAGLVKGKPSILTESSLSDLVPIRYGERKSERLRAIGKSWKHHELEAIVTGQPIYARDVSIPEMLFGQVSRPPIPGSKLISVDYQAAKNMPGVVKIVTDTTNGFVGVITEHPRQLPAVLDSIEIKWRKPHKQSQQDLAEQLDVDLLRKDDQLEHTLVSKGDYASKSTVSLHRVQGRYDTSFAAHAAMEPRAAVVSVKRENVEVWCGSQDPFFVQRRVAKTIGYPSDHVTVYPQRMGGGFGGRVPCQASEEAAVLSKIIGKPVRVEWDRETEFTHNYFQPPFSHHISAGVTEEGQINFWQHDFVSSPIITGLVPENVVWFVDNVIADEGTARGSLLPYQIENQRVRYSDIRTPISIGAWRGLGAAPNSFAIESAIDELANSAGIDPLTFRLKNLKNSQNRLSVVLKRVAKIARWGRTLPQNSGLGIACAVYKGETPVAIVAEVGVDPKTEDIEVSRVWCVQDCGLVINPDQVENQIAGNIIWGCSMALKEQLTFEAGLVEQTNFDGYEILRHDEAPQMYIELVRSEEKPSGVGESAFAPVAPAIANAIFAATGKRPRRLPISLESVSKNSES